MIFGEDFVIRRPAPPDNTNGFKTGDAAFQPLKTFFVNQAQELHQHGIAKTYVEVGKILPDKIFGFAILIASEIDIRGGYVVGTPEHANRYSSPPAVKLARLAVDSRYFCLAMVAENVAPHVGCRFLVTDAK